MKQTAPNGLPRNKKIGRMGTIKKVPDSPDNVGSELISQSSALTTVHCRIPILAAIAAVFDGRINPPS